MKIIAAEEIIVNSEYPEWHLESEKEGFDYLIDFNITKRLVFKMGNGKTYYFSLVKVEDNESTM